MVAEAGDAESIARISAEMRDVPRPRANHQDAMEARRAEALTYRLAGLSWSAIGERLGMSLTGARDLVKDTLRSTINRNVEEMRELENQRLDRAQAAIWSKVLAGELPAIDRFLKISAERNKINGTYAPTQIDLAVSIRREMEESLRALEQMTDSMIIDAEVVDEQLELEQKERQDHLLEDVLKFDAISRSYREDEDEGDEDGYKAAEA